MLKFRIKADADTHAGGHKRLRLTVDSGEQENLQIHHVVDDDGEIALRVAVARPAPMGGVASQNTFMCAR